MNITEPLPEFVELEYQDEIWQQPLDYEHIPFQCRNFHEYDHLYKVCPLNKIESEVGSQAKELTSLQEDNEGFQEVSHKKKNVKQAQTHLAAKQQNRRIKVVLGFYRIWGKFPKLYIK